MFSLRSCSVPGCNGSALTGLALCSKHCPDIEAYQEEIRQKIIREGVLRDHDISGIALADLAVEGVQLSGCNLCGVSLTRVRLRGASMLLVFSDRAVLTDCDFSGSTIRNSVLADSQIARTSFTDCDILQCNFMGARCKEVAFDHSNLYSSRFVAVVFDRVGMRDCNLLRARFDAEVHGVDFKASNTNEATFLRGVP